MQISSVRFNSIQNNQNKQASPSFNGGTKIVNEGRAVPIGAVKCEEILMRWLDKIPLLTQKTRPSRGVKSMSTEDNSIKVCLKSDGTVRLEETVNDRNTEYNIEPTEPGESRAAQRLFDAFDRHFKQVKLWKPFN